MQTALQTCRQLKVKQHNNFFTTSQHPATFPAVCDEQSGAVDSATLESRRSQLSQMVINEAVHRVQQGALTVLNVMPLLLSWLFSTGGVTHETNADIICLAEVRQTQSQTSPGNIHGHFKKIQDSEIIMCFCLSHKKCMYVHA